MSAHLTFMYFPDAGFKQETPVVVTVVVCFHV